MSLTAHRGWGEAEGRCAQHIECPQRAKPSGLSKNSLVHNPRPQVAGCAAFADKGQVGGTLFSLLKEEKMNEIAQNICGNQKIAVLLHPLSMESASQNGDSPCRLTREKLVQRSSIDKKKLVFSQSKRRNRGDLNLRSRFLRRKRIPTMSNGIKAITSDFGSENPGSIPGWTTKQKSR